MAIVDSNIRATEAEDAVSRRHSHPAAAKAIADALTEVPPTQASVIAAQQAAGEALTAAENAEQADGNAIPLAQKGEANGVATLGADGKVLEGQLPPGSSGDPADLISVQTPNALVLGSDNKLRVPGVPSVGGVESVTHATGELLVNVDNTDAANPVISSTLALLDAVEKALSALQDGDLRDFAVDRIVDAELADGAATDRVLGLISVLDQAADGVLVPIQGKYNSTWIQRIRNNLKWLFGEVETIKNLGSHVGTFNTRALVPDNASFFTSITINDFVNVRVDETQNNAVTRYIADAIAADGTITWEFDIAFNVDISGMMPLATGAVDDNLAVFKGEKAVDSGLAVGNIWTKGVAGTYVQGTDFDDLQEFLDAKVNNKWFESQIRIDVNGAMPPANVTVSNVLVSGGSLRIQSGVKVAETLTFNNIKGQVLLYGATGVVFADNLNSNYVTRIDLNTDITFGNGVIRGYMRLGAENITATFTGNLTVESETGHINVQANRTLHVVGNFLNANLLTLRDGSNFIVDGTISDYVQIVDNRPNRPLETFARKNEAMTKGVPGVYTQIPADQAPSNEFEFNSDIQDFLDININNRMFSDGFTINVTRTYSGDVTMHNVLGGIGTYAINSSVPIGNRLYLRDISRPVYMTLSDDVQIVGTSCEIFKTRASIRGNGTFPILTIASSSLVLISDTPDSNISVTNYLSVSNTGGFRIPVSANSRTSINRLTGDGMVTIYPGANCEITDLSSFYGMVINGNQDREHETFRRKGGGGDDNTFTTVPDYAAPIKVIPGAINTIITIPEDGFVQAVFAGTNVASVYINESDSAPAAFPPSTTAIGSQLYQVKAGDTIRVTTTGTPSYFQIRLWQQKIIWVTTPATEFNTRLIGQPDYANMESINRISTVGGTWTADRDGYVYFAGIKPDVGTALFRIDGQIVGSIVNSISPGTNVGNWVVAPISRGQICSITVDVGTATELSCQFIPPVSIAPQFITGADMQKGTQSGEVTWDSVTKIMSVIDGVTKGQAMNSQYISIPVGSDLNDYRQPGNYGTPSSATATTLLNCPTVNYFRMEVVPVTSNIFQLLHSPQGLYYRHYGGGTPAWSAWTESNADQRVIFPAGSDASLTDKENSAQGRTITVAGTAYLTLEAMRYHSKRNRSRIVIGKASGVTVAQSVTFDETTGEATEVVPMPHIGTSFAYITVSRDTNDTWYEIDFLAATSGKWSWKGANAQSNFVANSLRRLDNPTYSTTEQVVGFWTDNKPIYRRVLTGTSAAASATSGTPGMVEIAIGATIDKVISRSGQIELSDGNLNFLGYANTQSGAMVDAQITAARTHVRLITYASTGTYNSRPVTIILEYTKA